MRIAIIGAGNQGTALGGALETAGHTVVFARRGSESDSAPGAEGRPNLADAVRQSEALALTVPSWRLEELLTNLSSLNLSGRIVIDVTNPLTPEKGWARGFSTSNAELVASALPTAEVVKAFNTVFASWLTQGGRALGEQLTGFVASDSLRAKQIALGLVRDVGLDPVDAGGLESARLLEAVGVMLVRLGAFTPLGWSLGMRLVHPRPNPGQPV